jgi:hypothetical protein
MLAQTGDDWIVRFDVTDEELARLGEESEDYGNAKEE